jgi:cephalosporin hydroxylase
VTLDDWLWLSVVGCDRQIAEVCGGRSGRIGDRIPSVKNLLVVICLGLLTSLSLGCNDSESPAVKPSSKTKTEPSQQYAADIEKYEHAMGTTHGLTPEQIHAASDRLKAAPVFQNKFLGIWTVQQPVDAWVFMELMYEIKPDLIIEAGTFHGGSAAFWAIILEHINPDGRIITIDIEDQREKRAIELPIAQERVDFLLGSSTDPKIVAEVHRRAEGKRVLVLLDSLHSKEHVAAELEAYAPLVPVGSYVVVQDTLLGPTGAIDEFLEANDSFVADRGRERYPDTSSVRGYLRRIKP